MSTPLFGDCTIHTDVQPETILGLLLCVQFWDELLAPIIFFYYSPAYLLTGTLSRTLTFRKIICFCYYDFHPFLFSHVQRLNSKSCRRQQEPLQYLSLERNEYFKDKQANKKGGWRRQIYINVSRENVNTWMAGFSGEGSILVKCSSLGKTRYLKLESDWCITNV